MKKTEKIIKIEAKDQVFGRLASKIAFLLQGKTSRNFQPNKVDDYIIEISNISEIKFSGRKLTNKKYFRHSGFPGGLKSVTLGQVFKEKPEDTLKQTVFNMLPNNRNRRELIKKVKFIK